MMRLYKLNKTVLRLWNNPSRFLNGLTSNTLDKPRNAFLNIHGRIIATFELFKADDDTFYLALEPAFVNPLLEHLDRHIKLSGVKVEKTDKKVYCDLDTARVVVADEEKPASVTDEEFTLFRLKNNMPLQGVDYTDEMVLNVSETEFVSFTKGCFLGQEPVAKVHNRSKPTWKLVVRAEDECTEEEKQKMTSRMQDPASGKISGFVFVPNR